MAIDKDKLKSSMAIAHYKLIMNRLGAKQHRETEKEIIYYTDICHGGCSPKLFFYKELSMFKCYTECGSYDIFTLIMKRLECSFYEALNFAAEVCGFEYETLSRKTKLNQHIDNWQDSLSVYMRREKELEELNIYDEKILSTFKNWYHKEWVDENITYKSMDKYEILYNDLENQIIIPVRNIQGNLIGIRLRNMDADKVLQKMKYMPLILKDIEYTFPINEVLYSLNLTKNNIKNYKKIVIFEGEKSVLKMDGYYGDNNHSAANMGTHFSKSKRNLLISLGVEECIFAFDKTTKENFKKMEKIIMKNAEMLLSFMKVSFILDTADLLEDKDSPIDKGKEVYEKLYNERKKIDINMIRSVLYVPTM